MQLKDRFKEEAKQMLPWLIEVRRHLHAHPELSFEEHETVAFVSNKLSEIGISTQKTVAGTGIVAEIQGRNPESRLMALRADLDALPIHEKNNVSYVSRNKGVMHACGHDVHTTSLIGAANILHSTRDQWEGTVRLLFQPGEERLPGGATLMIKDGALEDPKPQGILGQHVFPDLPVGKVGFRSGLYMASCDELHVTVHGRGGHAAMPHQNIDPVLIASHMIVALQQIVSRHADPEIPCVLSFGRFIAEGATNVIPSEVSLQGTFRTMDEPWREKAHALMQSMAEELVSGMGGKVDFRIDKGYPFLINDPHLTVQSKASAVEYLGADNVVDLPIRMTGEDFSYYTHVVPGCFYRLGTSGTNGEFTHPVHHPNFDIDEQALLTGAGLMAWLAVNQPV